MNTFQVESEDVVRLVLQFLKENNLTTSMQALQDESKVALNTVDNIESLMADINHGQWESVIPQVSTLSLPFAKLVDLYEQIVLELLEAGEVELAREILRTADPFTKLRTEDPEKYLRLEHWVAKGETVDPRSFYAPGSGKEKRRAEIAEAVAADVSVVPPSRLLAIVGQALRWQQMNGVLPKGEKYDLFKGALAGQIKFGSKTHAEVAVFSPDGQHLVSGSADGFVEVWDYDTCRLRKDLTYQAKDEYMMHDEGVLACAFSRDGEHLATGSKDGKLKVWNISTGQCLRRFEKAHTEGISSLCFAHDGTQILTGSHDHTVRIHGLKGGKTLKVFRGHSSFVNAVCFSQDGSKVVSGSSDGSVKLWNTKTTECLVTFTPSAGGEGHLEASVQSVFMEPGSSENIIVATRSSSAYLCTPHGSVLRCYTIPETATLSSSISSSSGGGSKSSSNKKGASASAALLSSTSRNVVCACPSPRGTWLYCGVEDGSLHCFDLKTGAVEKSLAVAAEGMEVAGVAHHPHRNLLASFSRDGTLRLWKA